MRILRASAIVGAFAVAAGTAAAQDNAGSLQPIRVRDWKYCEANPDAVALGRCVSHAGLRQLVVYERDGTPDKPKDMSAVRVEGSRLIDTDYNLVGIPDPNDPGKLVWVQLQFLDVVYCGGQPAMSGDGHGEQVNASGMGSGAGCPQ